MPTYEYACKSCGEHLEAVQSFKDDPLTECPNCGGVLRKVYGNVGIAFKGSGFYKTDSRSSTSASATPSSSGDNGSSSKDASSSSTPSSSSSTDSGSSGSSGSPGSSGSTGKSGATEKKAPAATPS